MVADGELGKKMTSVSEQPVIGPECDAASLTATELAALELHSTEIERTGPLVLAVTYKIGPSFA